MRKIISLICLLLPIVCYADELVIRENAPDRYVVVKGDTLWDISNKFFKDPWKWPEIWGINKDAIKDPHWIYPGNVIVLDPASKTLHLGELPPAAVMPTTEAAASAPAATEEVALVPDIPPVAETKAPVSTYASPNKTIQKYRPKIRVVEGNGNAIASIPIKAIAPFLSRPLIIETEDLQNAPTIIGSVENRNLLSFGDTAFANGLPVDQGTNWQAYRPGKAMLDPDSEEVLGYEAVYLGDAVVQKFDEVSTLRISKSVLDILKGDNLIQSAAVMAPNYIPRSPPREIKAKVISVYDGVNQAGQNAVITINKGRRDGLDIGHVLALYKESEATKFRGDKYTLPALRYGLIFVFRTFEKVSYALVMEVQRPVQILDTAETP